MQTYEIIVVADAGFVPDTVRAAWRRSGVKLSGPFRPEEADEAALIRSGGVVIDVSLEASELFGLSERLLQLDVPFLFVVGSNARSSASGLPYRLTERQADIAAILNGLTHEHFDKTTAQLH
ncbi:hypothetical protein AAIH46_20935 [Rhizobium sp. 0TCS1.26]|uniref:hypothetical protein n=1 Tax=Rhizobium sp. 0TCS1.26 TaxID=3142623 RepID=UPI003D289AA3